MTRLSTFIAAVAALLGLALALRHPLGGAAAATLFVLWTLAVYRWPRCWPVLLPALLPLIGLAPWSGWLTVEEVDLMALGAAAGGHARRARTPSPRLLPATPIGGLTIALFALSLAASALRGYFAADPPTAATGLFQGYHEAFNALRLAKPFVLALLLLPLWTAADAADTAAESARWRLGLSLGLGTASLAALWERLAFTDLLNFSTDYRTTGLFWEMHVGGAALDGFLALTVPFALAAALRAHTPRAFAGAAALLLLAGYACLTTFSRGVYLAVPLGAALLLGLLARQQARAAVAARPAAATAAPADASGGGLSPLLLSAGVLIAFSAAAAWLFPTSGYRGLLALIGAGALLLRLVGLGAPTARDGALGAGLGLLAVAVALAAGTWLSKGPYLAYAALWVLAMAATLRSPRRTGIALGATAGVLASVALVAGHWGGDAAFDEALPVAALLALAWVALARPVRQRAAGDATAARRRPSWRWQVGLAAALCMSGGVVAALSGGSYIGDRFATSRQDLDGRVEHWREGVAMLRTPIDWLFGRGLGRYASLYALEHRSRDAPGDYRLFRQIGGTYLILAAGRHEMGWGELLRLSQRIDAPQGPLKLRYRARADEPVQLHFEVCEKHLLYNGRCTIKEVEVRNTAWQDAELELGGAMPRRDAWYAPKLIAFSMANGSGGTRVAIDGLELIDADGRDLLANGDFSDGLAHWFVTSDRHHMPWHLKNLAVHVLVQQGALGLLLTLALFGGALWRLTLGPARQHALAPPIAAALLGFAVVGLFDSLLDVPRITLLFYLLLLAGLRLRPLASAGR